MLLTYPTTFFKKPGGTTLPGGGNLAVLSGSALFIEANNTYFQKTFSVPGDRRTWTYSCWFKPTVVAVDSGMLFSAGSGGGPGTTIIGLQNGINGSITVTTQLISFRITNSKHRDPSAWYHLVIAWDTTQATANDRIKMYINGVQETSFSTFSNPALNEQSAINNNVIHLIGNQAFNFSNELDAYLADIYFINAQALDASSFGGFDSDGNWQPIEYAGSFGTNGFHLDFSRPSFIGKDAVGSTTTLTDSTAALWTGHPSFTFPGNSIDGGVNSSDVSIRTVAAVSGDFDYSLTISDLVTGAGNGLLTFAAYDASQNGLFNQNNTTGFAGGMTNHFEANPHVTTIGFTGFNNVGVATQSVAGIKGDQYTLRRRGSTISIIKNGITLHTFSQTFAGSMTLVAGHHNNADRHRWDNVTIDEGTFGSENDFHRLGPLASADSPVDNYAVFIPIEGDLQNSTYSNGNKTVTAGIGHPTKNSGGRLSIATDGSIKTYVEFKITTIGGLNGFFGLFENFQNQGTNGFGNIISPNSRFVGNLDKWDGTTRTTSDVFGSYSANDVIMIARDGGDMWAGKNGVWLTGDPFLGTSPLFSNLGSIVMMPGWTNTSAVFTLVVTTQVESSELTHTIPTGFITLNTNNLPDPPIANPQEHFNTVLYTGNASAGHSITGAGFQPDLVWTKRRSIAASHSLYDSVRGPTKAVNSNALTAESTYSDGLVSFDADGFTSDADTSSFNTNGPGTYAAWMWKEGVTPGFDIVTYTGNGAASRNISHTLGVTPSFILLKHRSGGANSGGSNWRVFHQSLGGGVTTFLNQTNAATADPDRIGGANSSTFNVLDVSNSPTNASGGTYVAYLWAGVDGFSKFGSYIGNGVTDGPFIHCGFRPAFVIIKRTNISENWIMLDSDRSEFNLTDNVLYPNLNQVEVANHATTNLDFLSNGIKIRGTNTNINASGSTYMYAAFADAPFKTARAR